MIIDELRSAIRDYDDWPTDEKRARVIRATRLFVDAVDQRAEIIEHMRRTITPSEQALGEILGTR